MSHACRCLTLGRAPSNPGVQDDVKGEEHPLTLRRCPVRREEEAHTPNFQGALEGCICSLKSVRRK